MGEIGIDRLTFLYELRLWEINAIVKGYRKRAHTQWESTRWQTFCILCSLGAKLSSPRDLLTFPWEMRVADDISQDEAEQLQELMKNINSKNDESEDR